MYHAIDSHVGPVYRLNYFVSSVYFVTFMVTVTFFLINLLVGSVIVSFQQFSTKYRKNYNLDRNQVSSNLQYISVYLDILYQYTSVYYIV